LVREVCSETIDDVCELTPGTLDAFDDGLTTELALGTDFERHTLDLGRKVGETVHHRVDNILEFGHGLSPDWHNDLLSEVATGDGLMPCQREYDSGGGSTYLTNAGNVLYLSLE
jgi:hypothetical protein